MTKSTTILFNLVFSLCIFLALFTHTHGILIAELCNFYLHVCFFVWHCITMESWWQSRLILALYFLFVWVFVCLLVSKIQAIQSRFCIFYFVCLPVSKIPRVNPWDLDGRAEPFNLGFVCFRQLAPPSGMACPCVYVSQGSHYRHHIVIIVSNLGFWWVNYFNLIPVSPIPMQGKV